MIVYHAPLGRGARVVVDAVAVISVERTLPDGAGTADAALAAAARDALDRALTTRRGIERALYGNDVERRCWVPWRRGERLPERSRLSGGAGAAAASPGRRKLPESGPVPQGAKSRKRPSVDLVTKSVTKTRRNRQIHILSSETAAWSLPRSRRCVSQSVRHRWTPGAPLITQRQRVHTVSDASRSRTWRCRRNTLWGSVTGFVTRGRYSAAVRIRQSEAPRGGAFRRREPTTAGPRCREPGPGGVHGLHLRGASLR